VKEKGKLWEKCLGKGHLSIYLDRVLIVAFCPQSWKSNSICYGLAVWYDLKLKNRDKNGCLPLQAVKHRIITCLQVILFPKMLCFQKNRIIQMVWCTPREELENKDYMRIYPKEMLDLQGRQKPSIIAQYMTGSFLINCYNSGSPTRLHTIIKNNEYRIRVHFYDSSRRRIGSQAIFNRLETHCTEIQWRLDKAEKKRHN